MPTILVSGANRGIGLELARQYANAGWRVIGTVRRGSPCDELRETGASVHVFDATDQSSAASLARDLDRQPIDVLVANAGAQSNLKLAPHEVTRDEMLDVIEVNTFGPLLLAAALKPNLLLGERRIACAMSSLMSSITRNDWGTQYVYRASKTALNSVWCALAREWRGDAISCVLLRPGFVRTRMTDFQGADVGASVAGLRQVIEGLTLTDSGRFMSFDGTELPW